MKQGATKGAWSRRLRAGRVLLAALSLVAVGSSAYAADVCMEYTGGGSIILKRFKPPSKNKCAPVAGVENATYGGALSGMACTNAAGNSMTLQYTSHDWQGNTSYFESATCRVALPLPTNGNSGTCTGTYISTPGGSGRFLQDALFRFCNANVPS